MCGLFGTLRPKRYPRHLHGVAASALFDLGYLAEERGVDSAGLATLHGRSLPVHLDDHERGLVEASIGRWRVVTVLGAFSERLPERSRLRNNLRTARAVLGHTRWATQGAVVLSNASPMVIGDLIGTHNGDVTTGQDLAAGTDSAWLFDQLARAGSVKGTLAVLTGVRGRAALAWARRSRPELVFLSRTALSPLWTATDPGGAVWWASNPMWLREVASWRALDLSNPVPLREGTLIGLRSDVDQVTLAAHHQFVPTSRPQDERSARTVALRGFTLADRRTEMTNQSHQVQEQALWRTS